jgi:FkbM family methyltransferase
VVINFPTRLINGLINRINRAVDNIFELIISRKIEIKSNGITIFTLRNFGFMTRYRARTFWVKEPETIGWIDQSSNGDSLLDIGANIGIYSIYAATKGMRVCAIEPNALNFSLLNLNILDNDLNDLVVAFPISVHSETKIAELNMDNLIWGGALASFDRKVDYKGNNVGFSFRQGSSGTSIDDFVRDTGFRPSHIKIDVDGNEILVLNGGKEYIRSDACKSILIELYEPHKEYQYCLDLLSDAGFVLVERTISEMYAHSDFQVETYIFAKSVN